MVFSALLVVLRFEFENEWNISWWKWLQARGSREIKLKSKLFEKLVISYVYNIFSNINIILFSDLKNCVFLLFETFLRSVFTHTHNSLMQSYRHILHRPQIRWSIWISFFCRFWQLLGATIAHSSEWNNCNFFRQKNINFKPNPPFFKYDQFPVSFFLMTDECCVFQTKNQGQEDLGLDIWGCKSRLGHFVGIHEENG